MEAAVCFNLPSQPHPRWRSAFRKFLGKPVIRAAEGSPSTAAERENDLVVYPDGSHPLASPSGLQNRKLTISGRNSGIMSKSEGGSHSKVKGSFPTEKIPLNPSSFGGVAHELLVRICEHLDDTDCMRLRFVNKEFRRLLDEGDWFWKHLAVRNLAPDDAAQCAEKISKEAWVERFTERNLIHNPSGEQGLKGWKITTRKYAVMKNKQIRPAYRWTIENVESTTGPSKCFVASHCPCLKWQTLNLVERGFNPQFLDTHQPPIVVSDCFSTRWDANSLYSLTVMLLDSLCHMLAYFSSGDQVCPSANAPGKPHPFRKIEHTFRDYGKGVRYIYFEHSGMEDMNLWRGNAGHYGAHMKYASIRVLTTEAPSYDPTRLCPLRDSWRPASYTGRL